MPSDSKELFALLETAAGYVLLEIRELDVVALNTESVQESLLHSDKFHQVITVRAIHPFGNAEEALMSCCSIAAGEAAENLITFLNQNLPTKKKRYQLGVIDPSLGKSLSQHGFPVLYNKSIIELMRLARYHLQRLVKELGSTHITRFQVGLGHAFSRSKIRTDPNRQDKPVQNAIALLENINKTLNTFTMRVKEWYSWHFPELSLLVPDHIKYTQVIQLIGMKENFTTDRIDELVQVLNGDEALAKQIMNARVMSMGQEISSADMINILNFTHHILRLVEERNQLVTYLNNRLQHVAPNLQALVGDVLAAKLITHAGSLTNLSKCPASTIQILGAEKALFRALKTKGNTPKYGLLFQSSFVGRAATQHKGRISRYIANKCSLAARIDNFSSLPSNIFGEKMRDQVESRLNHLSDHVIPLKRNVDVMKQALAMVNANVSSTPKEQETKLAGDARAMSQVPNRACPSLEHKSHKKKKALNPDKISKKDKKIASSHKKKKKNKSVKCVVSSV